MTAPNSPRLRGTVRITAYPSPQRMAGNAIRRSVCHADAPSVAAAASCSTPISRSTGSTSRTTNGSVTTMVARTMLGTAKMIWIPQSARKPNQPSTTPHEDQRDTHDHRRDREREVDDRLHDRTAAPGTARETLDHLARLVAGGAAALVEADALAGGGRLEPGDHLLEAGLRDGVTDEGERGGRRGLTGAAVRTVAPGSTSSRCGSASATAKRSGVECSPQSRTSTRRSEPSSPAATTANTPSCGPRQPRKFRRKPNRN